MKTLADAEKLPFGLRAQLASAAAWSPNPKKPPFYLDLPIGADRDAVLAKWAANAPLAFVDQYIANLRQYHAIAMDVGDEDGLRVDAGKLHDILDSYGVANSFTIYPGTHTSNVAFRFQDFVMPFFSSSLSFDPPARPAMLSKRQLLQRSAVALGHAAAPFRAMAADAIAAGPFQANWDLQVPIPGARLVPRRQVR